MVISRRVGRRVRRDFPEPGSASGVMGLLAGLPDRAGYDRGVLSSERVQAAAVVLAAGSVARLHEAIELAMTDWRDLLVAAGLADDDWPQRLDLELGTEDGSDA
jgi:hypothetical protein